MVPIATPRRSMGTSSAATYRESCAAALPRPSSSMPSTSPSKVPTATETSVHHGSGHRGGVPRGEAGPPAAPADHPVERQRSGAGADDGRRVRQRTPARADPVAGRDGGDRAGCGHRGIRGRGTHEEGRQRGVGGAGRRGPEAGHATTLGRRTRSRNGMSTASRGICLLNERQFRGSPCQMGKQLDATDWTILRELQRDGRLSFNQLGKRVNLSSPGGRGASAASGGGRRDHRLPGARRPGPGRAAPHGVHPDAVQPRPLSAEDLDVR